jgi:hypothetical protein
LTISCSAAAGSISRTTTLVSSRYTVTGTIRRDRENPAR